MDFPVYIEIGDKKVLLHTILEPLAFFIGFRYLIYLKKKKGDVISSKHRFGIIVATIIGALVGSRLIGGLENPNLLVNENWLLHFYSNKTVLGGLIGGLFAVEIYKRSIGEKKATGDLFVYPILLALIIGRIGCFSMGVQEQTYGIATDSFSGMDLGDGIYRHPVAIYEIIFLILLWIGLLMISKKMLLTNGALFKLFMIAYLFFRFGLDFIKPHYTYSIGLSAIQAACIIGLIWYLRYLLQPAKLFDIKSSYA
jgi:phosphatidylglycerol:prolipoprotein diacylglycerol transferase